jgi:hypothetical protein
VLWKYSSSKEIESCFVLLCSLSRSSSAAQREKLALSMAAKVAAQDADNALKSRLLALLYNFFPAFRYQLLLEFM